MFLSHELITGLMVCCCVWLDFWWSDEDCDEMEDLKRRFCCIYFFFSPPNVLTESLTTGQMCSFRHIHRDVGSHGLLESTIYKRCHKSGPPSRRATRTADAARSAPLEKRQNKHRHGSTRSVLQTSHDWTGVCWKHRNRQVGAWRTFMSLILIS